MNKTIYVALISILFILRPLSSSAQFNNGFGYHTTYNYHPSITYAQAKERGMNLKPWWRSDMGIYMPFGTATFTHVYRTFDNNGNISAINSASSQISLKPTFGISEGLFCPIITMKDNSMLAFAYAGNFYIAKFEIQKDQLGSGGAGTCGVYEGGVALSLDYKFGVDAMLDKKQKTGITFGAGFYPNILIAGYKEYGGGSLNFDPFVKVDFSFFMGVCFKLKTMVIFRNGAYLQTDNNSDYNSLPSTSPNSVSIIGSTSFAVALVVLPYSWDWGND